MSLIYGTRYFKYDNDGNLRVYKLIKKDPIVLKEMDNKHETVNVQSEDELNDIYVKLNQDAIISFNIVDIHDLKDVIVMVYRKKEIVEKNPIPYSICRQNITDFFANSLDPNMQCCGVNVTIETLPEGVKMEQLTACDGIEKSDQVSYYMGDSIDNILSYLDKSEYDNILFDLFMDHIEYKSKTSGGKIYLRFAKTQQCVDGYSKTLRDLLQLNNFMYDLMRGFNIYPLNIDLTKNVDEQELSTNNRKIIESLICKNIAVEDQLIIKYDKDIDLSKISKEWILVYDKTNTLYLISFSTYGKYHIPVEDIESDENVELMAKSIRFDPKSSITEAYNSIALNRDKYK